MAPGSQQGRPRGPRRPPPRRPTAAHADVSTSARSRRSRHRGPLRCRRCHGRRARTAGRRLPRGPGRRSGRRSNINKGARPVSGSQSPWPHVAAVTTSPAGLSPAPTAIQAVADGGVQRGARRPWLVSAAQRPGQSAQVRSRPSRRRRPPSPVLPPQRPLAPRSRRRGRSLAGVSARQRPGPRDHTRRTACGPRLRGPISGVPRRHREQRTDLPPRRPSRDDPPGTPLIRRGPGAPVEASLPCAPVTIV